TGLLSAVRRGLVHHGPAPVDQRRLSHRVLTMTRALYRHADLHRLISPASIAIVGASAREGSFGLRLLRNLASYTGRLHLVNSRYEQIEGRPCHPSLAALPEVPDCAVIAAPREQVEVLVEECGSLGVGGVIVFASGFAE